MGVIQEQILNESILGEGNNYNAVDVFRYKKIGNQYELLEKHVYCKEHFDENKFNEEFQILKVNSWHPKSWCETCKEIGDGELKN